MFIYRHFNHVFSMLSAVLCKSLCQCLNKLCMKMRQSGAG
uniref:Uncharacterized protein n=1 Tax=Anguilla anguilla TaxID=7936 RepID=A0A0E9V9I2_ANGAN